MHSIDCDLSIWLYPPPPCILILPVPGVGATIFDPLVWGMFFVLQKITFGKMDDKISKWKQWEGSQDSENPENMELVVSNDRN